MMLAQKPRKLLERRQRKIFDPFQRYFQVNKEMKGWNNAGMDLLLGHCLVSVESDWNVHMDKSTSNYYCKPTGREKKFQFERTLQNIRPYWIQASVLCRFTHH